MTFDVPYCRPLWSVCSRDGAGRVSRTCGGLWVMMGEGEGLGVKEVGSGEVIT